MTTEQEILNDLIQAVDNTNRSNDDFLNVLKEGRDKDVALRDGTVVPSLTKRVVNAFSNSDYLMKADNLASVVDKQEARDNLDVYSQAEVDTAIANASFGFNQTYTDVTASRSINTVFTNSSPKPIFLAISVTILARAFAYIYCGANEAASEYSYISSGYSSATLYAIVNPFEEYRLTGALSIANWRERS